MRTALPARPRRGEEEGATLLIVVLALLVIFGMIVLTVDVGAELVMRRRLVNAADSAALAAAQACGKKAGQTQANADALQYAQANVPSAELLNVGQDLIPGPRYSPSCNASAGTVTVKVQAPQVLAFAPVLGGGTQRDITATAVATWGGTGHGKFLPFMLSLSRLTNCKIPDEVNPGDECTFWMNNGPAGLGNSQWAMLNLTLAGQSRWGWDVPRDYGSCVPADTKDTITWIHTPPDLYLNYPAPTFVCVDTGATPPTFEELESWAKQQDPGTTFLFPVNDPTGVTDQKLGTNYPHGQVNRTGVPCPPPCTSADLGPVDKFDIVGFAELEIVDILRGNKSEGGDVKCGYPSDSNAWCLVTKWVRYFTDPASALEGENFGRVIVRLIG